MEQYVKYLRKSRFDRDYAELSVEETLKRHEVILDNLAANQGYHVSKTYYEVATGESIAARPEVQKLLEEVNAGMYAGVLVVDVERLARGNGADQGYISQVFQFSSTKIITPTKVYDPSNEYDEEYFEFGLFMSRREYKTINRRLVRGRESSAAEGKYVGSIAPFGYNREKLDGAKGYILTVNEEESPVVQHIFDMFLHGKGVRTIASELTDSHVPTRHGDVWSASSVKNILRNPVYIGKIKRGFVETTKSVEDGIVKSKRRHLFDMSQYKVYQGLHQALIEEEDFAAVQRLINHSLPDAKVKRDFALKNPFAGLLFCHRCGKRMTRTTQSLARQSGERVRCSNCRSCHNGSSDFKIVEREILSALRSWLVGYKVKIDMVGYADDIGNCKRQYDKLSQDEVKLKAQLENAYNLVEQGVYTLELFKYRRETITQSLDDIHAKQNELQALIKKMEANEAKHVNLIPQTEELLASYDDMTNEERNAMLKTILYRIEYEKGEDRQIILDVYPKLPKI